MQYAMIDGKQRFEAISGFFEGNVILDKTFIYYENPDISLTGLTYHDLKANYPDVAEKFDNFNLSVVSVVTDEEEKISELFVRLNRSRSLTGAEIRNAMAGPIPELIRDVAEHRFFTVNVKFDTTRGEDLNTAAKLLLTEFRGQLVNVKKPDLDGFVEEAIRVGAPLADFQQVALRTTANLERLSDVFAARDPLLSSQGPPVIYYWMARYIDDENLIKMRPFLVQFDDARRRNRQFIKQGAVVPSDEFAFVADLIQFDNFNRNTNDAFSLQGRLDILLKWFGNWTVDPQDLTNFVRREWEFASQVSSESSPTSGVILQVVRTQEGWGVRRPTETTDLFVHANQATAARHARDLLRRAGGGRLVVYNSSGSVRNVDSVLPG